MYSRVVYVYVHACSTEVEWALIKTSAIQSKLSNFVVNSEFSSVILAILLELRPRSSGVHPILKDTDATGWSLNILSRKGIHEHTFGALRVRHRPACHLCLVVDGYLPQGVAWAKALYTGSRLPIDKASRSRKGRCMKVITRSGRPEGPQRT